MTQTWAIFYDAYRSLNAKKMFWVVLIISVLVAAAFACVGINQQGLKILVWQFETEPLTSEAVEPAVFYKFIFASFGIGVWLAWIATMLALASTAGIFPDLLTSGSIDLLVSKPIGRLRLFVTQYAAGLLFVTLQVTLFSVACFLVIGLRGGAWEPGLFMAIPLMVCFFSYLFSMCVLLGVVTRSTVAALLLTLLFWFFVYGLGAAENTLLTFRTMEEQGVTRMDMHDPSFRDRRPASRQPQRSRPPRAASAAESPPVKMDAQADSQANAPTRGGKVPRAIGRAVLKALAEGSESKDGRQTTPPAKPPDKREKKEPSASLAMAHDIVYGVKTVLPKTTETIGILERTLYSMAELPAGELGQPRRQAKVGRKVQETLRSRSVWWVVGTSLGFELFVLSIAALIFCRRDF